jgi:hypothetical protein
MGAPVPAVKERARTDSTIGFVVLSETGVDRLAIGSPTPAPQVNGTVSQRVASQTGLVFNDADGNERGGLGYLDNGTVALGLDYPGREGVSLAIVPRTGFAGLTVNAPQGSKSERAELGVLTDGTSLFKLADTSGTERAMLLVQGTNPAKLLGIAPRQQSGFDVGVSWLYPGTGRTITIATGREFMSQLANLNPETK